MALSLSRNYPHFMETEGSLPHSQELFMSLSTARLIQCMSQFHVLKINFNIITYLLTYFKQQSPSWEANRFSASREIPHTLWNPKVHYHIHKCPPPVTILSQLDPVIPHPTFWRSSHLRLGLPSGLLPSGLSTKTLYLCTSPLPHTCYMPSSFHSSQFSHLKIIG